MEGITGVASADQLSPASFEYQKAREWMTGEVNAAIQGAREAGATEFVISDSHGNGQSLLIDKLPTDIPVMIVRSFPRPLGMMEGIDSTFSAVIFIGYHAATTSMTGVRAHTMSSALLTKISLNGTPQSEAGINAAIAAHFGVPVVMITGDDAIVEETKQRLGNIEGVIVKHAIGFHSVSTMVPEKAAALIHARAKIAVGRRAEMKPYAMSKPVTVEVSFKNYRPVELLGYLQQRAAHRRAHRPPRRPRHDRGVEVPRVRHQLRSHDDAVGRQGIHVSSCNARLSSRALGRRDRANAGRIVARDAHATGRSPPNGARRSAHQGREPRGGRIRRGLRAVGGLRRASRAESPARARRDGALVWARQHRSAISPIISRTPARSRRIRSSTSRRATSTTASPSA